MAPRKPSSKTPSAAVRPRRGSDPLELSASPALKKRKGRPANAFRKKKKEKIDSTPTDENPAVLYFLVSFKPINSQPNHSCDFLNY
ncbi:hypothetical protein K0M31_005279 [Melipona bicolor]|uniref:Uncharacterized protein n=1 Tax=Melipona bicolor TaxID=60889 RepID=A0AA40KM99_9HYME|nr:hypothetical protein K0M31_005279 [Melipona bicolor]